MKNELTTKIRNKGWLLNQFLVEIGYSLRWYRSHCNVGDARYEYLCKLVGKLEDRNDK